MIKTKDYFCEYAHGFFRIGEDDNVYFNPTFDCGDEVEFGNLEPCFYLCDGDLEDEIKTKNYFCDYTHGVLSICSDGDIIFSPTLDEEDGGLIFGLVYLCDFVCEGEIEEDDE